MEQTRQDDIVEIGNRLRSAQASISLATELLGRPDTVANCSAIEIYKVDRQLRSVRNRLFPSGYFADVAWEIMVDLFLADSERRKLSIADLRERNEVPLSTLLRYLTKMEDDQLVVRIPDHHDKRRVFIKLTPLAEERLRHAADATRSALRPDASTVVPISAN